LTETLTTSTTTSVLKEILRDSTNLPQETKPTIEISEKLSSIVPPTTTTVDEEEIM